MNIIDYIDWRGDLSFSADPLNRVDALILSHIIYLHFDNLVDKDFSNPISLKQLAEKLNEAHDCHERTNLGLAIDPKTVDLFFKCAESKRFGDIKITGFVDIFDTVKIEQFCIASFLIGDDVVISVRGTDDTIIGWYEDFNLSYMKLIPSQIDASAYFEKAAKKFTDKSFVLLGHSKGGYVAVGTAVNADAEFQKRIRKVYNLDGPGYIKSFFESAEFKNIEDKLETLYPEDDYVGMLQRHPKNYMIIKADKKGIAQHNPLNWQILGNDFVKGNGFTRNSKIFYKTINEWSESISYESKEKIVKELFTIYLASDCVTNLEISQNKAVATRKIIKAFNERTKETKDDIFKLINILIKHIKTELPVVNMFEKYRLLDNGKLEEIIEGKIQEVKKLEKKISKKVNTKLKDSKKNTKSKK